MATRLEREAEFHDRAFGEDTRAPVWKYYEIQKHDAERYARLLDRHGGGTVLEYGCGAGSAAYHLARNGAHVVGIDISPVAIEQAAERAERAGVADRCTFRVMNAEQLDFPDDSFDLICGSAILHHLDLDRAYPEIARTMRPGGHGVFFEPLGHNALINAFRNRTPQHRTPDEHPLLMADLELARRFFGHLELTHFHLATLAALPIRGRRGFDRLVGALDRVDRVLFRVPALRRQSWMVVIELGEPRPPVS